MDLLFTISTESAATLLEPLLRACTRSETTCQVFLTHEGVRVLESSALASVLQAKGEDVVACHDSWQRYGRGDTCVVTLGSQTNHSEMAGNAMRIISL